MKKDTIYIYGKHAVEEALAHAPHAVEKVYLAKGAGDDALRAALEKAGVSSARLGSDKTAEQVARSAVHQGVVGRVALHRLVVAYEHFIDTLDPDPQTALVLLGGIQDPHNVGAIIRSAAAFGISAVLIPRDKQAPVTGAVVKVSAGMAFRIPLVAIGNVNAAVRDLKDRFFWIYGMEGGSAQSIARETFDKPSVFIFGNEAEGLRLKTRELCDTLLSIPMHPRCESLNVAASAAATFYAWSAQHPKALK